MEWVGECWLKVHASLGVTGESKINFVITVSFFN